MTLSAEARGSADSYLAALRKQLRDLMEEDTNDIVEEIRAHILDKTTGAEPEEVEQTLAALGTPAVLAARYRTEELMKRAEAHRSGAQKTLVVLQRTGAAVCGLAAFAVSVVGYFVGALLVVLGVLKAVYPHGTGLWVGHYPDGTSSVSFSGGSGNVPPANAHDLLGWWLVPLGLVLGAALLYATYRFGAWAIRTLWRPRNWRVTANEHQLEG